MQLHMLRYKHTSRGSAYHANSLLPPCPTEINYCSIVDIIISVSYKTYAGQWRQHCHTHQPSLSLLLATINLLGSSLVLPCSLKVEISFFFHLS